MTSRRDSVPYVADMPSGTRSSVAATVFGRHLERLWEAWLPSSVRVLLQGAPEDASVLLRELAVELGAIEHRQWIVVPFGARENQRRGPALSRLVRTIEREARRQRRRRGAGGTVVRAYRSAAGSRLARPLMAAALVVLVVVLWQTGALADAAAALALVAGAVGAFLAVTGAGRDIVRWIAEPLTRGSIRASDEPELGDELRRFVSQLNRPVAVLIDQVHQSKASYVAELFDDISTQLKDVPIVFVAAADRLRLADIYLEEYTSPDTAREVLDLSFPISIRAPAVSAIADWEYLLAPPPVEPSSAKPSFDEAATESQIRDQLSQEYADQPIEAPRSELVRAASDRLGFLPLDLHTQHVLQELLPLLPPTPRSYKRFVNAYALARDFELLRGVGLPGTEELVRLGLWVILEMRWPLLADYLVRHPEAVADIGVEPHAAAPEVIASLFADPDVARVVQGEGTGTTLSPGNIRALARA
jgi:hypothetical protein